MECKICLNRYNLNLYGGCSKCRYKYCDDCFRSYVITSIKQKNHLNIKCPNFECKNIISHELIRNGVTDFEFYLKKYEYKNRVIYDKRNCLDIIKYNKLNLRHCPNCNVMVEKVDGCDHMICSICSYSFSWNKAEKVFYCSIL